MTVYDWTRYILEEHGKQSVQRQVKNYLRVNSADTSFQFWLMKSSSNLYPILNSKSFKFMCFVRFLFGQKKSYYETSKSGKYYRHSWVWCVQAYNPWLLKHFYLNRLLLWFLHDFIKIEFSVLWAKRKPFFYF